MPMMLNIYIYTIFTIGTTLSFIYLSTIRFEFFFSVFILAMIAGLLDKYCVELPNGTLFSGSSTFTFTVLALYGLPEAVLVEVVSALFGAIVDRLPLNKAAFNIGQYAISLTLAGLVYSMLGGPPESFALAEISNILIVIAVYIIVNSILMSVVVSCLNERNYLITLIDMVKDSVYIYWVTTLLSLRLILVFDQAEQLQFWIETFFIFIIFLALRYAFGLFINLRKTYLNSMESLTHLTETRLSISGGHATRVGRIARQLAEELKLPQEETDAIHYAALLHDLGKVQLEENIFRKRGPLTLEEEKEYRKHVEIGAEMVKDISGLEKASEYIRYHHESWDGEGFLEGKKGEEIPLGARIIAAANEYDHLNNDKNAKNPAFDFEKLVQHKLDPLLVKTLMQIVDFGTDSKQAAPETEIEDKLLESIVISEARNKFYQSQLLKKFGASLIVTYDGAFRDEQGRSIEVPCSNQVLSFVEKARVQRAGVREVIEDSTTGKIYDIYCVPSEHQVHIMFFDVSYILDYEKKQEEHVKSLYRDVIYSVTQGKLQLVDEREMSDFYQADLIVEAPIKTKMDVPKCRELVQNVLEAWNVQGKMKFNILLCTSEVATNVLKHANDGQMKVYRNQDILHIIVQDNGSGIELSDLPKSTLLSGYSSKLSMGQGFNLLLKLMDRVVLSTGPQGTTVVMEMKLGLAEGEYGYDLRTAYSS
ncbi:MAG: HD domain-containing protein [Desulfitobacteriaceae bacterium]|nr:HD domain-containing protein [Desulfitobacteriaceae bacterium]MDI6916069.1 HD domain-containing protein [Desulfitobacteriaceae bacterium]